MFKAQTYLLGQLLLKKTVITKYHHSPNVMVIIVITFICIHSNAKINIVINLRATLWFVMNEKKRDSLRVHTSTATPHF